MDKVTEQLVTYTAEFSDSLLTESVKGAALTHLLDTVACAIAGYEFEASQIARNIAGMVPDARGASIFGTGNRVMPEMAAFANGTMIRITEWNDGMFAQGGGHPSEMISAILAVGESEGSTPKEVLVALTLAYELLGALGNTFYRRREHWGQATYSCPAAAALAVGKLMGLDEEQLASVVSLALLTVPLSADHGGNPRAIWKGSAVAAAMRRAIFAANCVKAGMRGAPQPFEGWGGFWEKVSGPFELTLPAIPGGPMVVEMSYIKRYPTEAHTQALIGFVLSKVRSWTTADELESFDIETYWHARNSCGLREKGSWDPPTREDAHHSLPYTLSAALVDGDLTMRSSFTDERVKDPALRPVMEKFTVRENEEFTANYRPPGMEVVGNPRYRVSIRKKTGEELHEDVTFPKGHMNNPMTVDDINAKLDDACRGVVDDAHMEEIRAAWWNLEKATNIADAIGTLRNFDNPTP